MSKHTPGPWQVVPAAQAQSPWIVSDSEGGSVADCEPPGPWMSNKEADANARLVAAAPDMLALLEEIVVPTGRDVTDVLRDIRKKARAAIAKAESTP